MVGGLSQIGVTRVDLSARFEGSRLFQLQETLVEALASGRSAQWPSFRKLGAEGLAASFMPPRGALPVRHNAKRPKAAGVGLRPLR
jgi:hypothetical protein